MRSRWLAASALAASLTVAGPGTAGDWLARRMDGPGRGSHGVPGSHAHATHPTIRGVMAMQSPRGASRPEGIGVHRGGGIRPFGSVQTGLESGIGYGYPTLYARPGRGVSRRHPWR